MATDRIRYVNAASAGGDGTTNGTVGATAAYASISAAWDAEYAADADLVTGDERLVINCEGTTADTVNVNAFGKQFTTAYATGNYVLIRATGAHRHLGYYSTGHFRFVPSSVNSNLGIINLGCDVVLEGLQISMAAGLATNPIAVGLLDSTTARVEVSGCILRASGTGTPSGSAAITTTGITARRLFVRNTLIQGGFFRGVQARYLSGAGRCVVDHCTMVGLYRDGVMADECGSGRVFLRNNRIDTLTSPGKSFELTNTTASTAGNYTADAYSPDGASYQGKTFVYRDAVGGDYHIGGTGASPDEGTFTGTDLSADATQAVTDDVDSVARTAFFAGYDEYAAGGGGGGGGSARAHYYRRRRQP